MDNKMYMRNLELHADLAKSACYPSYPSHPPKPISLGDYRIRKLGVHGTTAANTTISMSSLITNLFVIKGVYEIANLIGGYYKDFFGSHVPNRGVTGCPLFGDLIYFLYYGESLLLKGSMVLGGEKYRISWGDNLEYSVVSEWSHETDHYAYVYNRQLYLYFIGHCQAGTECKIRIIYDSKRP